MRTVKSKSSTEEAFRSVAYNVNKPKKRPSRQTTASFGANGFMTVSQLPQAKAPLKETVIDGHSLYLRPPSVYFMELLGTGDVDAVKLGVSVAEYLAENLYNDREGKNLVGTAEDFKKQFGLSELVNLFQKLNEGLLKKKAS